MTEELTHEKALRDLSWLRENGALNGVAAVITERRRQIESLGYDVRHDNGHGSRELARMASMRALDASATRCDDRKADLAASGALAAAGIDKMLQPGRHDSGKVSA